MLRALWLLALLLLASPASAQTFPPFTGLVVDAAHVLPPATAADLTAKLETLQRDTHRQLVVATIPDLQGYDVAEYGYKLGRSWGVGLRDVNNGIILFIAPNEPPGHRGPRIEVGKGLEPIVTDALASQIINQRMMPQLQAADVPGAITAGTDALVEQLRAAPEEAKARADAAVVAFDRTHRTTAARRGGGGGIPIGLIFWGVILLFVVLPALGGGRRRGRRWGGGGGNLPIVLWSLGNEIGSRGSGWGGGGGWTSGGGGGFGGSSGGGSSGGWGDGGFSGGGGGDFGGGGASGSW